MAVLESPPVVYGERLLAAAAHLRLCCYELHTPTELPHFDPAAIGSFFENFGRSRRRLAIVEALDHLRRQRDMTSRIEEKASVGVHKPPPGHFFLELCTLSLIRVGTLHYTRQKKTWTMAARARHVIAIARRTFPGAGG